MKILNGTTVTLGVMEGGQFLSDIDEALAEVLRRTKLVAVQSKNGVSKGSLTITVGFAIDGETITLAGDIKPKIPSLPRRNTTLFVTDDGQLSTEHPRQSDMFAGPRDVAARF